MPIMAAPAQPAQVMEGRGAFATWQWESAWVPFGVLWNSTGQPAMSVPAGFSKHGLPLAVQFVGAPHGESHFAGACGGDRGARGRGYLTGRAAFDC